MNLSIGTNWDMKLVDLLSDLPGVCEIYGSASDTSVGNGRPSFILGKISDEDMPKYIDNVHKKGCKFNYTMNAPCLNNIEYSIEGHRSIITQLDQLVSIGIDGITVSIPYLLEIVKNRYPQLSVKVSVIAQVNTVKKAKYFENLGADEIILDNMINRDFKLLEEIKRNVNCKLTLLLNDACIYWCPYRYYHYNLCGHASQTDHVTQGFYVDYCAIRCTMERLQDPSLLLSSRWIRPEDTKIYEDIGYDNFKLSGRRMSTNWIFRATSAYSRKEYNGSLSDIIDYSLVGIEEDVRTLEFQTIVRGATDIQSPNFMKLAQFTPKRPYINNNKLDGFIDYFVDGKCNGICDECNYCKEFAKKSLEEDEAERKTQLEFYQQLHNDLVTSSMFQKNCNSDDIIWDDELKKSFANIMKFAPEPLREIATTAVLKGIEDNVRKRNDITVIEEDMVFAFFEYTPSMYKQEMLQQLTEHGINLNNYSVEV